MKLIVPCMTFHRADSSIEQIVDVVNDEHAGYESALVLAMHSVCGSDVAAP